jgi:hypothetical protein
VSWLLDVNFILASRWITHPDRPGYRFLADDVDGTASPQTGFKETTDAHLIALAKRHNLKLATLDRVSIAKPWAIGIASNPLLVPG